MITYIGASAGYSLRETGPYDDPDYVANMTAGPYQDEDNYDEPYLGPWAVYDP